MMIKLLIKPQILATNSRAKIDSNVITASFKQKFQLGPPSMLHRRTDATVKLSDK